MKNFFYHYIMRYFSLFFLFFICLSVSILYAEEKSTWQKFVDFFSPTPTVEGEGPLYDKLRDLDKQINKAEGRYSRERRPNNKAVIKKEIEELKKNRNALANQIKENEKNTPKDTSLKNSNTISSTNKCSQDTIFIRDTIAIHDTTIIHDTLYVIVADEKPLHLNTKDSTSK